MTVTVTSVDMTDVLSLAALDHDLDPTPVIGAPQAQGDLLIAPWGEAVAPGQRAAAVAAASPVTSPVTVIEGRGGNAHVLVDPDRAGIAWAPQARSRQTLGTLIVPTGGRACLDHAEHGRMAIGEGVWVIRRQREQADEIRMVAD